MKVYRGLKSSKINEKSLGLSWTLDESFAENHVNDSDDFIVIESNIDEDCINWGITLAQSIGEYKHEYEVFLECNIEIKFNVLYTTVEELEEYYCIGNTGDGRNSFDETLSEIVFNDEMKKEWLKMANKF